MIYHEYMLHCLLLCGLNRWPKVDPSHAPLPVTANILLQSTDTYIHNVLHILLSNITKVSPQSTHTLALMILDNVLLQVTFWFGCFSTLDTSHISCYHFRGLSKPPHPYNSKYSLHRSTHLTLTVKFLHLFDFQSWRAWAWVSSKYCWHSGNSDADYKQKQEKPLHFQNRKISAMYSMISALKMPHIKIFSTQLPFDKSAISMSLVQFYLLFVKPINGSHVLHYVVTLPHRPF